MAAGGKTTSTERLLDIIRGKGKGEAEARPAAPPSRAAQAAGSPADSQAGPPAAKAKAPGGRFASLASRASAPVGKGKGKGGGAVKGGGAGLVLGVDIGPDCLRLAKVSQSGGRSRLLGVSRVPYTANEHPESPEFAGFLAAELRKFAGNTKGADCWSLISSAKAELWHVLIPKVSRGQIQEAVYWTVKREKQFDEREFLLDFEVQGEVMDKGQPKLSIMVYLAPRKQVEDLKALFARAGVKLAGATISPIGIQTLFRSRWISPGVKTYAHLYVGRNWSRIDILIDDNIVLSRGIKAGTNSMVEALMENYNMMGRGGSDISMPGDSVINLQLDDDMMLAPSAPPRALTVEQAKGVLRAKLLGQAMPPHEAGAEISEQDVLRMIRPAVERLVRQVERTFEYHTTTMGKERVEKIFFSGEICTNQLLIDFIQSQLGIANALLDPLAPGGQAGIDAAGGLPASERLDYNLVVALGLSSNAITPNLLFTYKDKEKQRQLQRVDLVVFIGFLAAVALLGGIFFWQQTVISSRQAELQVQQARLANYVPQATEGELLNWARKVNEKNKQLKRAAKIFESLSVFKELSELTPSEVRIVSMDMEYGADIQTAVPQTSGKRPASAKAPTSRVSRLLILDGVVLGNPENYDLVLTSFLIRLENSKLFGLPIIHKRSVEEFSTSGPVLRFTVHINMV
ncbi:type IV pilus biogenesis protein PilM [Megalodesulfovibrio gigas]|uniref:Type IV pilus assembly protein PilM n=1 Tax=Megalodesulfovibrio gigas (strain ATCC 19364 / DSM 1382 / NCIMB 9332 / VKM B-1759) TaxID=1121448 RepID=T2G602_MEGG1|nr:hypothetical protein [Megalodesulfovibrio gigas]AGW12015.1 putative conseved hypothetical protein [Megalodesulfovibrio gigas DSM 1382 = ATCC 19364]